MVLRKLNDDGTDFPCLTLFRLVDSRDYVVDRAAVPVMGLTSRHGEKSDHRAAVVCAASSLTQEARLLSEYNAEHD